MAPNANVAQLQDENRRLQKQLKRAELERDIFKKKYPTGPLAPPSDDEKVGVVLVEWSLR